MLVGLVMAAVSALMVSRIPTYSFKKVRVPPGYVMPVLILICGPRDAAGHRALVHVPDAGAALHRDVSVQHQGGDEAKRAAANDDAGATIVTPGEPAEPVAEPPADNDRPQAS